MGSRPSSLARLGAVHFLLQAQFWFPVWVLFLQHRGLSLAEVTIADAFFRIVVVVLELPMGMLGDRLGRKRTYLIAAVCATLTFLCIPLIRDVGTLFAVWAVWALFVALASGTDTAYHYERIVELGLEDRAVTYMGRFRTIAAASLVVSHLAAGFLYEAGPATPILFNAGFAAAAALLILTLKEPPGLRRHLSPREGLSRMAGMLRAGPAVRAALLLLCGMMTYYWTNTLLFQPLLVELGFTPGTIGLGYAAFSVTGIGVGLVAGRCARRIGEGGTIVLSAVVMVASVAAVGFGDGVFSLAGIAGLSCGFFLAEPVLTVILNRHLPNELRASMLSLASLLSSLLLIASRPLVGFVADAYGPRAGFRVWAGVGALVLVGALVAVRRLGAEPAA